jgi:hypothetical protein
VAKGREEELQNTKKAIDEINARYDKKMDDLSMAPSVTSADHIAKLEETKANELEATHEEIGRLEEKQKVSKISAEEFAKNLYTLSASERFRARAEEKRKADLAQATAAAQADMARNTPIPPRAATAAPPVPPAAAPPVPPSADAATAAHSSPKTPPTPPAAAPDVVTTPTGRPGPSSPAAAKAPEPETV